MLAEKFIPSISDRTAVVLRVVASCIAIVSGGLAMVVGVHRYTDTFSDRGPAMAFHSAMLESASPGATGRFKLKGLKSRPCKISSAALWIVDGAGAKHPATTNFVNVDLEIGEFDYVFAWTAPLFADPGPAKKAEFSVRHKDCTDGKDPDQSASIKIDGVLIEKTSRLTVEERKSK